MHSTQACWNECLSSHTPPQEPYIVEGHGVWVKIRTARKKQHATTPMTLVVTCSAIHYDCTLGKLLFVPSSLQDIKLQSIPVKSQFAGNLFTVMSQKWTQMVSTQRDLVMALCPTICEPMLLWHFSLFILSVRPFYLITLGGNSVLNLFRIIRFYSSVRTFTLS